MQDYLTFEDIWSLVSGRINYFDNYNDYRENITMAIQTQYPYIDEEQVIHNELIRTYSDIGAN